MDYNSLTSKLNGLKPNQDLSTRQSKDPKHVPRQEETPRPRKWVDSRLRFTRVIGACLDTDA